MTISLLLALIIIVLSIITHGIGFRRGVEQGIKRGRRQERQAFQNMTLQQIRERREYDLIFEEESNGSM